MSLQSNIHARQLICGTSCLTDKSYVIDINTTTYYLALTAM